MMAMRLLLRVILAALMFTAAFPAILLFRKHLVFAGQNAGWPLLAGEIFSMFALAFAIDLSKKDKAWLSPALFWLAGSSLLAGVAFVQLPSVRERAANENLAELEAAGQRQIRECGGVLPPLRAKIDAAKLNRDALTHLFSDPQNASAARFDSRLCLAGALACLLLAVGNGVLAKRRVA